MSGGIFEGGPVPQREDVLRRQEARLAAAVNGLMAGPEGRAFLRWLLALCRCFEAEAPAPGASPLAERLLFAEGARQVGMRLLRLLEAADPAHFPNLLLTREDDDGSDGSGKRA
ncbi:MAG: hypothetical protein HDR50_02330 [Desulfovibrio sp.]|uniref:Bbp19 family protein n=1 Tax=Desulfovibrio sp. TaxID=885 RepID=UPI001A68C432|nr:hypothetical protein [Desulfovibrio sp.]MBD5416512.1 hypothetical protein [Desulfovibrio sp.]